MSSIVFYYFCTNDKFDRMRSSIKKQFEIGVALKEFGSSKRVLVTDANPQTDDDLFSRFFSEVRVIDPYVTSHDGETHFCMSRLRNLAISSAKEDDAEWLYFCDADTIILETSDPLLGSRYAVPSVYWQKRAEENISESIDVIRAGGDSIFSEGNSWFMLHKDVFTRVDFNEKMHGYGYEDIDFHSRISAKGFRIEKVKGTVIHNFHTQDERNVIQSVLDRNYCIFLAGEIIRTSGVLADWRDSTVLKTADSLYFILYEPFGVVVDLRYRSVRKAELRGRELIFSGDAPDSLESLSVLIDEPSANA